MKILSVTFFVTVLNQILLGPGSCPTRMQCTVVFALDNGSFSMLGGGG